MTWLDWWLVFIPIFVVVAFAVKSQKYVKGVADFLSAGRVAGRYVVCVASGEAGMGLISVVAIMEMYYNCGFAVSFWSTLTAPIGLIMGLTGFCMYRYRETKAMTMGQFFEIRYSKSLRVVAAVIQSISGIVNYAIFPAVGARFLIYFLDLPLRVHFLGYDWPMFGIVMFVFLGLALFIVMIGGQVTIMVTDCVQGILSYPMYVVIVGYFLYRFSWTGDMAPTLLARPPGESFLSPYDVDNLRDFNLFYVFVGIAGMFLGRMSWGGTQGYNGAAKTPHEAKMGGLLGTWRGGFDVLMYILIAVVAYTYLNNASFAKEAREVRVQLAGKTIEDVAPGQARAATREELKKAYSVIPERKVFSKTYTSGAQYRAETADPYTAVTKKVLAGTENGAKTTQTFTTIYGQMLVPVAIREILPMGITGIFCALMIFLMVSTDTTYMHSWGSIIVQDFVVPLRKKAFTPHEQINALRWSIAGVCAFAFFFSYFFAQIDYILMFFAITGAIWSGAGAVITFGLYWKRGTTAGAFASLISGALISLLGIFLQQNWAQHIYPMLEDAGLVEAVGNAFQMLSRPFNPYIVWEMNANKFPVNSIEIGFISQLVSVGLYIGISLLTCRRPFNMDRMLHRGIYSESGKKVQKQPFALKEFILTKILGIDGQYKFWDKVLAWSVFIWSFGYGFILCFLAIVVWCIIDPWPAEWWSWYFFVKNLVVSGIVGIISTFWFGICGTIDLFKLFKALDAKKDDVLDDGRVIGNISASDVAAMKKIDENSEK